jgi:hypothetical protein
VRVEHLTRDRRGGLDPPWSTNRDRATIGRKVGAAGLDIVRTNAGEAGCLADPFQPAAPALLQQRNVRAVRRNQLGDGSDSGTAATGSRPEVQ